MTDLVRKGYLTEKTCVVAARSLAANFQTSVSASVERESFSFRIFSNSSVALLVMFLRFILNSFPLPLPHLSSPGTVCAPAVRVV